MNEEMNVEVEVAVEAEEVFEDETIVCAQCGKEFLALAEYDGTEQELLESYFPS